METLEVGHARECITPPLGIGMRGYAARTDGAADVHDDLFVNAVVLENGNERVAILAYDLCGFGKEGGAEFKSAIEQATGLDPDKVLLNASHTHAGPGLGRAEADQMENDYRQQVRDKGVEALRAALENTAPATFAVGAAPVDVGCNRRERQPDGSIKLGHNPGGPCLHEATVWRFARTGGDDVVLFSIPMHGTTLGQRNLSLSAEWMGRAVHFLETESPDMKAVFLQGCGGDQDPYYTVSEGRRGTFDELEQHGRDAATAVRTALEKMRELNPLPLRSVLWTTELPPKEDDGEPQSLPLHGVRVGDAVLVALGCEAFVEYALFGRATSPAKETLILGYSGGSVGYLPTADVYESGGYETRTSKVAPQSEQIVKEAMRRMFEELAR